MRNAFQEMTAKEGVARLRRVQADLPFEACKWSSFGNKPGCIGQQALGDMENCAISSMSVRLGFYAHGTGAKKFEAVVTAYDARNALSLDAALADLEAWAKEQR